MNHHRPVSPQYELLKRIILENVRTFRKQKNWTQEKLAAKLGLTANEVSRFERGELWLEVNTILLIGDATGHSFTDFLTPPHKMEKYKILFPYIAITCRK